MDVYELPSAVEMQQYDSRTIAAGLSSLELMERAGKKIFNTLTQRFSLEGKIVIVAGSGNNAGDGFVVARLLAELGNIPTIILVGATRYSEDLREEILNFGKFLSKIGAASKAVINVLGELQGIRALGVDNYDQLDKDQVAIQIGSADIVLDCLLGTGSKGAPRGEIASLIKIISNDKAHRADNVQVVAVDIPSGVDVDTGRVYEPAICADLTIAIQAIKRGMLQYPARKNCAEITLVDIGIECSPAAEFSLLNKDNAPKLSKRATDSHKRDFGDVLVLGGSESMPGAAALAAFSSLRCGAGLVRLATLRGLQYPSIEAEIMRVAVGERERCFDSSHLDSLKERIASSNALVLGPGLGTEEKTAAFVEKFLALRLNIPCVVDADALNIIALKKGLGVWSLKNCVLTPHPGEMARLLGVSTTEVQSDRYSAVKRLANLSGATVVLKGAGSIIFNDGHGVVLDSANPYLATAGSGDVLCGVIAALIAQGGSCYDSAKLGVILHAAAGDLASKNGTHPIIASDIISALPEVL